MVGCSGAFCLAFLLSASSLSAGEPVPAVSLSPKAAKRFEKRSNLALAAMQRRAAELGITGVGLVARFEGDTVRAWTSKMMVVGKMKNAPSATDPGANLLAIAYSKASEMADTHRDSGSGVRPPMKGEFGWQGGLFRKTPSGGLIAAFSGASSEDDLKVSRAGLDVLDGTGTKTP
jgi:hypothetical protein